MRVTWFSQSKYKTTVNNSGLSMGLLILCLVLILSLIFIGIGLSYQYYVEQKIAQRTAKPTYLSIVKSPNNHHYMRSRTHFEPHTASSASSQNKDETLKTLQTLRMHNALRFTDFEASHKK